MVAASDRSEVDTARPFRSVKEAVAVFGDRILVGDSHSRQSSGAAAIVTPNANAGAAGSGKHEASSSSSTVSFSPSPMAESEAEIVPATVPMYSAASSPPSLASSPSPGKAGAADRGAEAGLAVVRSIKKLEVEVAETRQEVAQLRRRGNEMEMAVASLNAQLHRGLSKLAAMEADKAAAAARRSVGGDSDAASSVALRSERYWGGGDRLGSGAEYLPSFSHALSLGEIDAAELVVGDRRRKAQKVKPIVPLIGDILFSKRRSTREKGDHGFYSGDLYSVLG